MAMLLTVTAEHFRACCAPAGNVACDHMWTDLQVFIDSKYKLAYKGRYTTDEEITGMLIAVLFAGQHTSSVTCTWTLLSMLANQVRGLTLRPAAPHVCPAAAPCTANYIAVGHKCSQLHMCCPNLAAAFWACTYEITVRDVSKVCQVSALTPTGCQTSSSINFGSML